MVYYGFKETSKQRDTSYPWQLMQNKNYSSVVHIQI